MRRSHRISLGLVPLVSATFLAACDAPQRRACVDPSGRVVADTNCDSASSTGSTGSWNAPSQGGFYRWYWYRGSSGPVLGNWAPSGGQYTAPSDEGGTHRGGFGETAEGHGSLGS